MASGGNEEEPSICYYYNTPFGCWNSQHCEFLHIRDDSDGPRPICRFFGTRQGCWYGDDCYFTHHTLQEDKASKIPGASEDIPGNPKNSTDANNNIKDTGDPSSDTKSDRSPKSVSWKDDDKGNRKPKKHNKKPKKPKKHDGKRIEDISGRYQDQQHDDQSSKADKKPTEESKVDKNPKKRVAQKDEDDTCHCPDGSTSTTRDVCGECGEIFFDGTGGVNSADALETHYLEMLGKADREHIKVFRKICKPGDLALCGACGRHFQRVEDLLRHLGSKWNLKRKEKFCHKEYFREIAHQFIDRDVGISSDDEDDMAEYLNILVSMKSTDDTDLSDDGEDDDSVDTGMATYISQQLKRLSRLSSKEIDDESDERANNHGFTKDEVYELMCQGIKPWDSDAYSALNVIYCYDGGDFNYDF